MYEVRFYKGDYKERQDQANSDGCIAYVEHHFNSSSSPAANYAVVITGANASETSRNWGRWYAAAIARGFNIPIGGEQGIMVGGYEERGDYNLRFTNMPAILLEPLFASNPQHAQWISGEIGQVKLAQILCDSIQRFFPKEGIIGFSVGHKYKGSSPKDRGAEVIGGGWEADYAEVVLTRTTTLLEQTDHPPQGREVKVIHGDKVLWQTGVDADANIHWDPVRGVLSIEGP
jgi:hypothetical protein